MKKEGQKATIPEEMKSMQEGLDKRENISLPFRDLFPSLWLVQSREGLVER